MIKIAVIDDNQAHINEIKELLKEYINDVKYDVLEYLTSDSFLKDIDSEIFDIVFLDIMLDKKDGIEIGLELNKKQPDANVIFISVNPEYFKDVYLVKHSYFLTKEIEKPRFFDAVGKALKNVHRDVIAIDTKNGIYKLVLNDIVFLESYLKHTKINMSDNKIIECHVRMKDIESLLPENGFVRTHQSFIVNMRYIKKYERQKVYLDFDKTVPISRTYVESARKKIAFYIGGII